MKAYSTKIVVATSIERAHVRLIEYFAEKQNRTRNEIIRHAPTQKQISDNRIDSQFFFELLGQFSSSLR
jgi:hypothetical protein